MSTTPYNRFDETRFQLWTDESKPADEVLPRDLLDEYDNRGEYEDAEIYEIKLFEEDGRVRGVVSPVMLYFPEAGRAGIAWRGGDADWTDCDSPEDAVRRWLDDEMTP